MVSMQKYSEIVGELEKEELESPSCNSNLYVKLMAYYLVQNKLFDAKFLWSRIPQNVKMENIELQKLSELQRSIFANNFSDVLKNLTKNQWSEEIKTVIDELKGITIHNVFQLIGKAYTSILDETLIELTNIPAEQFQQKCLELNWFLESSDHKIVVHPKKTPCVVNSKVDSQYQLSKLTEFVSFLEN